MPFLSLRLSTRLSMLIGMGLSVLAILIVVYIGQRAALDRFLDTSDRYEQAQSEVVNLQRDIGLMQHDVGSFLARRDETHMAAYGDRLATVTARIGTIGELTGMAEASAGLSAHLAAFDASVASMAEMRRRLGLSATQGLEGQLGAAVHAIENGLEKLDRDTIGNSQMAVDRLTIGMLKMRGYEKDFMLRGETGKYIGLINERQKEFEDALASALFMTSEKELLQAQLTSYVASVTNYANGLARLSDLQERQQASYRELDDTLNAIAATIVAEAGRGAAGFEKAQTRSDLILAIAALAGFIALIIGGMIVLRSITTPLRDLTQAMVRLAAGDIETEIPGLRRRDEIGGMAASVRVFKDNAIAMQDLERARAAEADLAEANKKETIRAMAEGFEAKIGALIRLLSSAAGDLESTANVMTQAADQTNQGSTVVAQAAEQTSANVHTVAEATEELSASIVEIARQVAQCSQIAAQAVDNTRQTDRIIAGLAESASRIGEVVALINNIAEKTNLLALNATIEAARAGDAGRGFAVVASEVKDLAGQTARATSDIAGRIAGVQDSVQHAVQAIGQIGGTISRIDEISANVALAVNQQGSATENISTNVQHAAEGTRSVARSIGAVRQQATETGSAAMQVLSAARELSQHASDLSNEVDAFLGGVRAA